MCSVYTHCSYPQLHSYTIPKINELHLHVYTCTYIVHSGVMLRPTTHTFTIRSPLPHTTCMYIHVHCTYIHWIRPPLLHLCSPLTQTHDLLFLHLCSPLAQTRDLLFLNLLWGSRTLGWQTCMYTYSKTQDSKHACMYTVKLAHNYVVQFFGMPSCYMHNYNLYYM